MALTFKYQVDTKAAEAELEAMAARGRDLRPALRAIGRAGVNQTRYRFMTGRDPKGGAWKKGRKTSGKTLIGRGRLLRSIGDRPPEANAVEWGSNILYARIHQEGGIIRPVNAKALRFRVPGGFITASKVTIPARPYLGTNEQDMAAFGQILTRHVALGVA